MGSRPMEHGKLSSGPSLQFAKNVLKIVLSSWVETLSSGHLEAGFDMIKHVQDILADSEEVGLDITNAKAFVDEVIALGKKWTETKSFPNGDFFNEMFLKPSGEVKSELDEISRTRKQFVRERNVTELAIIELTRDLHRLDTESLRPDSALSFWRNKLLLNGLPSRKLAIERGLSSAKLRRLKAISRGRLRNMNNGKFSRKSFLVLKMDRYGLSHFMGKF
ncbi:hypothetical protein MRB53_002241 [Persea americana]|uniref:Uncharacterized protein n=1 Tax=Persea americana TaxID=3435 RepID=A0ACC2MUM6_PERAE|nr:hypothetical protein MRB53_002241 [Persea americana]